MSTATIERATPGRPHAPSPGVTAACDLMATDWQPWHIVLYGLTWADYERLLAAREAAHRRSLQITYDRGAVEIMPPGPGALLAEGSRHPEERGGMAAMTVGNRHERLKKLLAALLENLIVETGGSYVPSGAITIRREDLERGFEPDECFYIQNAHRVLGFRELDFTRDPPPDLVLEIEVSRSILDKLKVIAGFGVPEVWRYHDGQLTVLLLQPDNTYARATNSRAFPWLPVEKFTRHIALAETVDFATTIRQFRDRVRTLVPPVA